MMLTSSPCSTGPFTQSVSSTFAITNPNAYPVAFKVKTTAPKQYCVRPNLGVIEPGGSSDVQVYLQAMRQDPPLDYKCKDKFLVQSMILTPDRKSKPLSEMWIFGEGEIAQHIHQQKVRVAYLPPKSQLLTEPEFEQPRPITDDEMPPNAGFGTLPIVRVEPPAPVPAPGSASPSLPSPPPSPRPQQTEPAEPVKGEYPVPKIESVVPPTAPIPVSTPVRDAPVPEPSQRTPISVNWLRRVLASIPPSITAGLRNRNLIARDEKGIQVNEQGSIVESQLVAVRPLKNLPPQLILLFVLLAIILTYFVSRT
ncbi:phosphatidylinositol-binding protein scs2 [Ceratobasidium sp. 428]|nr:phosphatidylinositol-binding protein scs2 [Ceratobasidium sp. 428]